MILDINKIIENDNEQISDIGWLLYNESIENGLDKEATNKIIEMLANVSIESTKEKDLEDAYEEGYNEGYRDARVQYECDCECCD